MKVLNQLSRTLAMLACVGMLVPQSAVLADEPRVQTTPILDIKLDQNGIFQGSLCTAEGKALPGAVVQLQRQGETVVSLSADEAGHFAMKPPQGGLYQLVSGQQAAHIRCWAGLTAPPHAQNRVQFIQGRVARGQGCTEESCTTPGCGGGGICGFLMNPLVIGTAIAAAIAIPLALDDDDDDAS